MPMRWRRITESGALIIGVLIASWMRYGLDASWWIAVACGVLAFGLTPFIVSIVLTTYKARSAERADAQPDEET